MDIETEQISAGGPAFPKTLIVAPIEFSPGRSASFDRACRVLVRHNRGLVSLWWTDWQTLSLCGMTRAGTPGTAIERLVGDLFDGTPGGQMADELAEWLARSARFREFGEIHRAKIRKKLRGAADPEARLDVRAELQTAHLLLMDRRIELAFEAYGSGKVGPDFTVAFRGGRAFNLEVTRPRGATAPAGHSGQLLAKLLQMPPSAPNAVLLAIEGDSAEALDVAATFRALRARADAKEESYFASRGFDGTRGFYDRYLRLGAVVVWCEAAAGDARAASWSNRSARIAFPEQALRACLACLRAG